MALLSDHLAFWRSRPRSVGFNDRTKLRELEAAIRNSIGVSPPAIHQQPARPALPPGMDKILEALRAELRLREEAPAAIPDAKPQSRSARS